MPIGIVPLLEDKNVVIKCSDCDSCDSCDASEPCDAPTDDGCVCDNPDGWS